MATKAMSEIGQNGGSSYANYTNYLQNVEQLANYLEKIGQGDNAANLRTLSDNVQNLFNSGAESSTIRQALDDLIVKAMALSAPLGEDVQRLKELLNHNGTGLN